MRIGQGAGGVLQATDKIPWLDECYEQLDQFDTIWSKERGWAKSIKLTTINV
jgi:hypothetical protein